MHYAVHYTKGKKHVREVVNVHGEGSKSTTDKRTHNQYQRDLAIYEVCRKYLVGDRKTTAKMAAGNGFASRTTIHPKHTRIGKRYFGTQHYGSVMRHIPRDIKIISCRPVYVSTTGRIVFNRGWYGCHGTLMDSFERLMNGEEKVSCGGTGQAEEASVSAEATGE